MCSPMIGGFLDSSPGCDELLVTDSADTQRPSCSWKHLHSEKLAMSLFAAGRWGDREGLGELHPRAFSASLRLNSSQENEEER